MGRRRGSRKRNKKNNNHNNKRQWIDGESETGFDIPVIEGFASGRNKNKQKKKQRKPRHTMSDHVVGQASDNAAAKRKQRKKVKTIVPVVPIELLDIPATSCKLRIQKSK